MRSNDVEQRRWPVAEEVPGEAVNDFLIIAVFTERDADAWAFHSGFELFTILYTERRRLSSDDGWGDESTRGLHPRRRSGLEAQ
ncbi:Os09g0409524 [Oryza sativa Japonica Group]|uniref:Os09g0409524 protein n=1 Tax=Oryza sativa subsp. japonica TaxID=39947 RepID=A0A0P0XMU9_ORYSJ|nr:Os09g0409524 [Oryza sativa Japonica Group]